MTTLTVKLTLAVVTMGQIGAIAAAGALVAALFVLVACRRSLQGTTLTGPWAWSLAAVASWGLLQIWFALRPAAAASSTGAALLLAAVSLSLCPAVALLGAKRPQHKAWNFVVLAFWAVLILPAAETLLLHPGQRPSLGGARGWFLWAPIFLGLVSYLPTRFGLAAIFVALGQTIALSPYLALLWRPLTTETTAPAYALVIAGVVLAWCLRHPRWPRAARSSLDRQWIDFRDAFGLFWALRVQERMNAASEQHHWEQALGWNGFHPYSPSGSAIVATGASRSGLERTFRSLLRRFVGTDWPLAASERERPGPPRGQAADNS